MASALKQSFFLPIPTLTERNLPDQTGRVFVVTGGYAGVGEQLAQILYSRNGTVYIAGRSHDKATKAISSIKAAHASSTGRLEFLEVDLSNLTTIRIAAETFMASESRLDVLVQNAGVAITSSSTTIKGAQGHEIQMVTNCIGPYLLAQCLLPILKKTASTSPRGSVRVTWAGSLAVDLFSPSNGGMAFNTSTGSPEDHQTASPLNYGQSKAGNVYLATEFARRYNFKDTGIISNVWNPGNLKSDLQRHSPAVINMMTSVLLYKPVFGAYTELWAGWSEEAGKEEANGKYIWPWGRFGAYRADVEEATRLESQGGTGIAAKFWSWCEKECKPYV